MWNCLMIDVILQCNVHSLFSCYECLCTEIEQAGVPGLEGGHSESNQKHQDSSMFFFSFGLLKIYSDYFSYTVSQKTSPTFSIVTWKPVITFLIIFGTNIPDTTCHQMTIQFSTSPTVRFCTTYGKQIKRYISWNKQKNWKKISDIIDCNSKKD